MQSKQIDNVRIAKHSKSCNKKQGKVLTAELVFAIFTNLPDGSHSEISILPFAVFKTEGSGESTSTLGRFRLGVDVGVICSLQQKYSLL